ncbi:hypothetical protein BKA67DRAFT_653110 [Truncatella angustata]|uniref:Calcium channel subunit cch1 n=1 Tax=Truncatella angustata TaxID=152316 RepID=A0A9P8UXC5_9PEZI|nr:uncharacterized protein BKA67DRAFT_653110 [Truncatella angustata]KAH6659903.1 hypothetical protein BKA67DRAFT_653110 [Truncatella angustata]
MQTSRFQSIRSRFSATGIRTSLRRASSSPVETINSVLSRQPSFVEMEEERKSFGSELNLLEPRPVVYWGGLEERMGSF